MCSPWSNTVARSARTLKDAAKLRDCNRADATFSGVWCVHSGRPFANSHLSDTAEAHTTGGRECGSSRTDDGRLDVNISLPGGPSAGTNPEQRFAAGWSTCLLSAIELVAIARNGETSGPR